MTRKRLLFALWIIPFFLGIAITLLLPHPAVTGSLLLSTFVLGEILYVGGAFLATTGVVKELWRARLKMSIGGGVDWLKELARHAATNNFVMGGLAINWVGASLYPVVLSVVILLSLGGFGGGVVVAILAVDIIATFAVRVPLLVFVVKQRGARAY